jgi:hypothetical protein
MNFRTYGKGGLILIHLLPHTPFPANNKIKTMKRQAYGFRDKEFFKLKIMAIHLTSTP